MKKVILALLFFAALSLCDASAQGLKGAPITSGNHREYKLAKVKGSSDLERWKNVAKIGPNLIGMSKRDVEAALGKGAFYIKDESSFFNLISAITESASPLTNVLTNDSFSSGLLPLYSVPKN